MREGNNANASIRFLDQEPDCIAVVPSAPSFVIIGTYSLLGDSDGEGNSGRKGSLQILPFLAPVTQTKHLDLDRKDFPFGIYDLHFHPRDTDLLGVATSNAEILFFRLRTTQDQAGSLRTIELREIGRVIVEEPHDDDGRLAIVTQFQFIDTASAPALETEAENSSGSIEVLLAATTQFGNTKLLKTILTTADSGFESVSQRLKAQVLDVHKQSFDLEAWTVLSLPVPSQDSLLVLSGGDDSQLLISRVGVPNRPTSNLDLDTITTKQFLTDKRSHTAGVVTICSLGTISPQAAADPFQSESSSSTLILTGSYDETLRLFILTPPSATDPRCTFKLLGDLQIGGGVWRITLLDQYPRKSASGLLEGLDYILLVAGHTAGVFIVRLSATRFEHDSDDRTIAEENGWNYAFKVEKTFTEHDSLVYAVAAKRDEEKPWKWRVVSTSFYDKKICNWVWNGDQQQP